MVLPWAMGNLQTINKFCGKDPLKTTVHDNTPGLHFPGCGMTQDQCTTLPCCDDALVLQILINYFFRDMDSEMELAMIL